MMTRGKPSPLLELLETLRETPSPSGRVLSVLLATTPDRLDNQAYLLAFRAGCQRLRAELPEAEHRQFEAAAAQAEAYLVDRFVPGQSGLALFASGDADYFYRAALPVRPPDRVDWSEAPELATIQTLLDDLERVAVLLFDKERARIFSIFLGDVETHLEFEDEVPGKQKTGGWFALAQTRFERHHEDHVLRHASRAAASLSELLRRRPFDRLFLAGPPEALALLRQRLPRRLRSRLAGTLSLELFASDADVRQAALAAAERFERADELARVVALLEAPASSSALGLAATLDALADERVHLLLVSSQLAGEGRVCAQCGRISIDQERCPVCAGPLGEPTELRELVVARALDQGAQVETVSGEAAEQLRSVGGIGALTRW